MVRRSCGSSAANGGLAPLRSSSAKSWSKHRSSGACFGRGAQRRWVVVTGPLVIESASSSGGRGAANAAAASASGIVSDRLRLRPRGTMARRHPRARRNVDAIEWFFDNPSNESFAFRARVGDEPMPGDGRISGTVFRDLDANGRRGDGEPGLEGAILMLVGEQVSEQTVSGPDGRYQFQVTEPGLYELIFGCPLCGIPPYPCQLTTPERRQVLIVHRPDGTLSSFDRGDFGCAGPPEPTHAAGVVFEDLDRNGQRDPGEPGIAGVRIISASVQCDIAAVEVRTDERGNYVVPLVGCQPGASDTRPCKGSSTRRRIRSSCRANGEPPPGIRCRLPQSPFRLFTGSTFGVTRDGMPRPELRIEGVAFHDANRTAFEPDEGACLTVGVSASGLQCASERRLHDNR